MFFLNRLIIFGIDYSKSSVYTISIYPALIFSSVTKNFLKDNISGSIVYIGTNIVCSFGEPFREMYETILICILK